jgi:mycofactocin system creatininase family protein
MPDLANITWSEAAQLDGCALILPVGSTEQHGPHLPVTTDTDIAVALAQRVLEQLPDGVVVAPPLSFGASGEHQDFPGTISIGLETTEDILVEFGRSASHSWPRMLFISTHGGNRDVVLHAVSRLRTEGRDARVWMPDWSGDAHAGRTETSLMLAIAPPRVRTEEARRGTTTALVDLMDALRQGGVRAVSANGILGDPTGASAAEGETMLASACASLVQLILGWPDLTEHV